MSIEYQKKKRIIISVLVVICFIGFIILYINENPSYSLDIDVNLSENYIPFKRLDIWVNSTSRSDDVGLIVTNISKVDDSTIQNISKYNISDVYRRKNLLSQTISVNEYPSGYYNLTVSLFHSNSNFSFKEFNKIIYFPDISPYIYNQNFTTDYVNRTAHLTGTVIDPDASELIINYISRRNWSGEWLPVENNTFQSDNQYDIIINLQNLTNGTYEIIIRVNEMNFSYTFNMSNGNYIGDFYVESNVKNPKYWLNATEEFNATDFLILVDVGPLGINGMYGFSNNHMNFNNWLDYRSGTLITSNENIINQHEGSINLERFYGNISLRGILKEDDKFTILTINNIWVPNLPPVLNEYIVDYNSTSGKVHVVVDAFDLEYDIIYYGCMVYRPDGSGFGISGRGPRGPADIDTDLDGDCNIPGTYRAVLTIEDSEGRIITQEKTFVVT